jgi:chromate transporter
VPAPAHLRRGTRRNTPNWVGLGGNGVLISAMPPDSPPAAVPKPDISAPVPSSQPGLLELFLAFAKMSLAGFGGVLGWARRAIVDQHRWMTAEEFNETFALCHFLPGPNIVNLSFVFGSRFGGLAGGLAAFAGLLGPPMLITTILASLYSRYGEIDALRRILAGVSCAAVGFFIAVVLRMMMPLIKKRDVVGMIILIAVFVAIGLLRLPLPAVLLVGIPLSLAITYSMRRRVPA